MTGPVPLHPQATDDPDVLRWVVPFGVLPFTGPVAESPGSLGVLLKEGVLARLVLEPAAVLTRRGAHGSWIRDGARVRSALHAALTATADWRAEVLDEEPVDADELLRRAVAEVLAGETGTYIRGHGGHVELVDAEDGVVRLRMDGACRGCPAAVLTLRLRLEAAVRSRCPWVREVRAA